MLKNPLQLILACIVTAVGLVSLYFGFTSKDTNLAKVIDANLVEAAFLFVGYILTGGGVLMGIVSFLKEPLPPKKD